jgi:hypothetical protein
LYLNFFEWLDVADYPISRDETFPRNSKSSPPIENGEGPLKPAADDWVRPPVETVAPETGFCQVATQNFQQL